MNFGALGPQMAQLLGTLNKSAGAMGIGAPGGAPGAAAGGAAPGPFTMPKGGLMGIISGKEMPNGLLGMIMNSMNQPKSLQAPGVAPAPAANFGSLMPSAPVNPMGPIY